MPKPTNFICTKCDFQGSTFSTWGSCSYLMDGKLIPVYREVAICYGCAKITSAEVLPTQERLDLFKNGNTYGIQLFYKEELQRFEALKDRATPARCLSCGSHDFELIPIIEQNTRQKIVHTGLIHKHCGGRIYADFDTPNLNMGGRLPDKLFNLEGEELAPNQ